MQFFAYKKLKLIFFVKSISENLKMKNLLCFCLSLVLVLKISDAQTTGNTQNSCFYAKNYNVALGSLIASIQISGSVDSNLAQCCEKCKNKFFYYCIVYIIKYFSSFL
jgi:hypothetical protein